MFLYSINVHTFFSNRFYLYFLIKVNFHFILFFKDVYKVKVYLNFNNIFYLKMCIAQFFNEFYQTIQNKIYERAYLFDNIGTT